MQVEAEATHLPTGIEVSVEGLDVGSHITAGDLALPSGATLVTDAETLLLNVTAAPTAEEIEADTAASIADLGIVEEPAGDEAEAGAEAEGEAGEQDARRRRVLSHPRIPRTAVPARTGCGAGSAPRHPRPGLP